MDEGAYALDVVLTQTAKWIKSHREKYAPISAISKTPNYRSMLGFLKRKGYIRMYKNGAAIIIEKKGWDFLLLNFPEIYTRHQRSRVTG